MAGDDKKNMESMVGEGRTALQKGDFSGAIEIWKRVIEQNPEHALTYNLIGTAYLHKGDIKEAKNYTKQALQRDAKNPAFMYNMAKVEMACGEFDVVVKIMELALTYESHDSSYWFLLGQAFQRQNKSLRAIQAYQRSAI